MGLFRLVIITSTGKLVQDTFAFGHEQAEHIAVWYDRRDGEGKKSGLQPFGNEGLVNRRPVFP